jgi:hypothetical protein
MAVLGQETLKPNEVAPYYPPRPVYADPRPATPPPSAGLLPGPFANLARSQGYAASRASSWERRSGPRDNVWVPATGEEYTLTEIEGPGAITHIWMTTLVNGRDLVLRIYWEGSPHPSVEAPLGDFFGVAMDAAADMISLPIQVSSQGRSRNCWWPMPFNRSARVTVAAAKSPANAGRDTVPLYFYIDHVVYDRPLKDIHYFHARFRETDPAVRGEPVTLVEAEGDGHFVGVVMGQRARIEGWFGEGDDVITIDGRTSFLGTGTEDYFSGAYGFQVFSGPYHGVPFVEERGIGSRVSAYRFHIADPIPFRKSFRFDIEHWPWLSPLPNTSRDYFSSVGFWYQKTVHKAWPRLGDILSHEPWDPAKGLWHVPGALEGEDLGILGWDGGLGPNARPEVRMQMPNLSGDRMLVFDAGGKGSVRLSVPVAEGGTYILKVYFARAPDFGIVELAVNGRPAGPPADTYKETDDLTRPLWPPGEYIYTGVPMREGLNELRLTVKSRHPSSKGAKVGLDCLVLERNGMEE